MASTEFVRAHRVRVGTFIRYAVAISILAGTALALALWWYPLTTSPPYMWFIWMVDFDVYRMGGSAVVNGLPLYDLKASAGPFPDVLPFTYTPFSAVLFVSLSVLDAGLVHTLWTVANVLAIGVAVWLALGMMGVTEPRRRLVLTLGGTAVAHLLDPVLANLLSGQINTLIMVLVLVSFASTQPKRWQGVPLGLAAGIKLTPLIFIVYLWLIGRRRAAVEAGAGFLATVVVGFVLLPGEAWRYWFGGVFHAADRVLISPIPVNNSLSGLFARLSGQLAAPAWTLAICALVGVLGLLAARRAAMLGHVLLGVVVVGFTAVLVSPVSWPAHAVWIVPALVWLSCMAWRNRSVRLGVVLAVVAAWFTAPVYLLAQRLDGETPYSYTPAGNLIATFGSTLPVIVVALATLPVWLPRLRAPSGDQRIPGDVPATAELDHIRRANRWAQRGSVPWFHMIKEKSMTATADDKARLEAYYGPFTSEKEKEVLGVPLRLVGAWAKNDVEGIVNVFTEDGILILPGDVYKKGRDEIRPFLAAAFAGPFKGTGVTGKPVDVRFASDDVALIRTHGGVLAQGEKEIEPELAVRSGWTCVKRDGVWYLASYQNSPRGAGATFRW